MNQQPIPLPLSLRHLHLTDESHVATYATCTIHELSLPTPKHDANAPPER